MGADTIFETAPQTNKNFDLLMGYWPGERTNKLLSLFRSHHYAIDTSIVGVVDINIYLKLKEHIMV